MPSASLRFLPLQVEEEPHKEQEADKCGVVDNPVADVPCPVPAEQDMNINMNMRYEGVKPRNALTMRPMTCQRDAALFVSKFALKNSKNAVGHWIHRVHLVKTAI